MKNLFVVLLVLVFIHFSYAQNVGIGTNTPNASAKLDVTSSNSGVLVPRVALTMTTAASPVVAPATSLLVYNTATVADVTPGYYYWTGAAWARFFTGTTTEWSRTGNSGTNAASNFIGTIDAVDFVTRTGNTERMRVMSTGNVGIGTAAPAYRLDLGTGTFGFGNSNQRTETRNNAGLQGNAGAQSGFFETSAPVNYPAGASSWWHLIDVRHSNTANNYALQIAGSFFDQELWFRKTNNNAAAAWTRILTSVSGWSTTGNAGTNAGTNFVGTTDAVDFVTRTSNTERMRVTTAGSVGIGISGPTQRLDVQGGNARINNAFIGDVGHGAGWAGFSNSSSANTTGYALLQSTTGDYTLINKQNTGSGYIGFRVANADVAVITNAGNMGIATTAPSQRLHVVGNAIATGSVYANNTSNVFYRGASSPFWPTFYPNPACTTCPGVGIENSEVESGGFWANGNVATIWSPGDDQLLRIYDEDGFPNPTQVQSYLSGFAGSPGTWFAGGYNVISDRSIKENLHPISSPLARLLQLSGFTYDIREDIALQHEMRLGKQIGQEERDLLKNQIGFVAQELNDIFPEVVDYSSTFNLYTVNYDMLIPVVVEAMKEQQAIITSQQEQIDALVKRLDALEKK